VDSWITWTVCKLSAVFARFVALASFIVYLEFLELCASRKLAGIYFFLAAGMVV